VLLKLFSNQGKSWLSFRAFILMLASVMIMLTAHYSLRFRSAYNRLTWIILPVQKSVDIPFRFFHCVSSWIVSKNQLILENNRLKLVNLRLQAQSQDLLALKKQNLELQQLFRSKLYIGGKLLVAQLLAIRLTPLSQQVVVNRGKDQSVYVGQPVLDGYGIMGQVINVAPKMSTILLITDQRFAVPVENYRTHMRAIAVGTGNLNELNLIHVQNANDIKVGDLFVSSSMALRFPISYPVGFVTKISHSIGGKFLNIKLTPAAHLNQANQVLLSWPVQKDLQKMVSQRLQKPLEAA
jgi:rod shape-determining protein MreC